MECGETMEDGKETYQYGGANGVVPRQRLDGARVRVPVWYGETCDG